MKSRLLFSMFLTATLCAVVDAQLLDDNAVYQSYATFTDPTVDGIISPGEWDAAGNPYVFSYEPGGGNIPEDPYGGDEDLSFQFRSMWRAPWDVFFLVEITDDIAMDDAHNPSERPWQRDQVELLIDGDELPGGEIRWWEDGDNIVPVETYGKLGVARTNEFEGNMGIITDDQSDVPQSYVAAAIATETGENGNYFVEYHVSLEPAFENGLFEGEWAEEFGTLVPDDPGNPVPGTVVKFDLNISDNDNFETADNNNSGNYGTPRSDAGTEWYESNRYANLQFTTEFVPGGDLDCDFDANATCDLVDIDALTEEASTGNSTNPDFDLDGDGQVGDSDIAAWLQQAGPENGLDAYLYGDSNLDGKVDATDLNAVGISWGQRDVNQWSRGNFGGSGGVAADDLNRLALNWQQSSAPLAASQSSVPEPGTLALFSGGLLALSCLSRRFRS